MKGARMDGREENKTSYKIEIQRVQDGRLSFMAYQHFMLFKAKSSFYIYQIYMICKQVVFR